MSTAALATGITTGTSPAHATTSGASFERVINHIEERQDWCNRMGCAEHQRTRADLVVEYTMEEDDDGNLVAKAKRAVLRGETSTWTDLVLAGFHATTQVSLAPQHFQTPQLGYGVDGRWIGDSSRTDAWEFEVPVSVALADRPSRGGTMDVNFWRG